MVHRPILAHAPLAWGYLTAWTLAATPTVDPTNQGGRPFLVSGAVIALLVALALLVLVYTRVSSARADASLSVAARRVLP